MAEALQELHEKVVFCSRCFHIDERDQLGLLHARPRDVVDLHSVTLRNKVHQVTTTRAQAYLEEGRLTVLELMGYLVSFYRRYYTGAEAQDDAGDPGRTNKEQPNA